MKKFFMIAAAVVMFAATANAQYISHDGTAENNIGVPGAIINWGTMFAVDPSLPILDSIDVGFGVQTTGDASIVGDAVAWQIFGDDDANPTTGLTPLSGVGTHNIVNENFQANGLADNIDVGGIDLSAHNFVFIGLAYQDFEGDAFPAAIDQDSDAGNSWASVPPALDPADYVGGNTIGGFGLPGNWIIAGNASAIPEPSTFGALALCAGLAAIRRRR